MLERSPDLASFRAAKASVLIERRSIAPGEDA
jgi:hypothetical protein